MYSILAVFTGGSQSKDYIPPATHIFKIIFTLGKDSSPYIAQVLRDSHN